MLTGQGREEDKKRVMEVETDHVLAFEKNRGNTDLANQAHGTRTHCGNCDGQEFHLALVQLMVVQLSEEREEHLDPTDGMDGTGDGVCHGYSEIKMRYESEHNTKDGGEHAPDFRLAGDVTVPQQLHHAADAFCILDDEVCLQVELATHQLHNKMEQAGNVLSICLIPCECSIIVTFIWLARNNRDPRMLQKTQQSLSRAFGSTLILPGQIVHDGIALARQMSRGT
ncbi:hypothetical protein EYF80_002611 [Liparis tanakae]|uniref:Uncharacterized protein n=1 Tax=Liparis tanakae TaxID=230148 RepID=A0A4Z2JBB1_9TELE|nr:hypothetical protein EYF80_002611 [Liparis tanakae]